MKKITLQIQETLMLEVETKFKILESEKESIIKANVGIKSAIVAKEDAIMIK